MKETQVENEKLQSVVLALEKDLEMQVNVLNECCEFSWDFKDRLFEMMLTVRTDAVRDFMLSDAYQFDLDTKCDAAREAGFDASVGQLQKKGLVPKDYNLEPEGVSSYKELDGSVITPESVADADLFKSEFVELVTEEIDKFKYNHGGPYIPHFSRKC